jgi:hypothetical protein
MRKEGLAIDVGADLVLLLTVKGPASARVLENHVKVDLVLMVTVNAHQGLQEFV